MCVSMFVTLVLDFLKHFHWCFNLCRNHLDPLIKKKNVHAWCSIETIDTTTYQVSYIFWKKISYFFNYLYRKLQYIYEYCGWECNSINGMCFTCKQNLLLYIWHQYIRCAPYKYWQCACYTFTKQAMSGLLKIHSQIWGEGFNITARISESVYCLHS